MCKTLFGNKAPSDSDKGCLWEQPVTTMEQVYIIYSEEILLPAMQLSYQGSRIEYIRLKVALCRHLADIKGTVAHKKLKFLAVTQQSG